jgi:predicted RNase H-like nuclease
MRVLGVDGAPGGWVGAVWTGRKVTVHHHETIAELFEAAGACEVVSIDIPIGLVPAGRRRADEDARRLLGSSRSSVFLTPVASVLEPRLISDYAAANAASRAAGQGGISRQAWGLLPRIAEVEAWRHTAPATVYETHPELSFQALNGGPLAASKKTWTGAMQRLGLLRAAGLAPAPDAAAGRAGVDDVLDACACAWSARRIAAGRGVCVPADPAPHEPTIWF